MAVWRVVFFAEFGQCGELCCGARSLQSHLLSHVIHVLVMLPILKVYRVCQFPKTLDTKHILLNVGQGLVRVSPPIKQSLAEAVPAIHRGPVSQSINHRALSDDLRNSKKFFRALLHSKRLGKIGFKKLPTSSGAPCPKSARASGSGILKSVDEPSTQPPRPYSILIAWGIPCRNCTGDSVPNVRIIQKIDSPMLQNVDCYTGCAAWNGWDAFSSKPAVWRP